MASSSFCCLPCPAHLECSLQPVSPSCPANLACHSRLTRKSLLGQPQAPGFPFSECSYIALCCPRLLLGWDLASEPVFPSLPVSTTLQEDLRGSAPWACFSFPTGC